MFSTFKIMWSFQIIIAPEQSKRGRYRGGGRRARDPATALNGRRLALATAFTDCDARASRKARDSDEQSRRRGNRYQRVRLHWNVPLAAGREHRVCHSGILVSAFSEL